jgi:two-component system sensor histidine kinase SenX3
MSGLGAAGLGLGIGIVLGALAALWLLTRGTSAKAASAGDGPLADQLPHSAHLQEAVLEQAPIAVLTLNRSDDVLIANRRAQDLGLLDRRGVVEPLLEIARAGRQSGETTREIELPTRGLARRVLHLRVRATPLPDRIVALVVEDLTEAHRVELVRRDFVANVSHEIKTPVGAVRLLAEAALESISELEGADDARHFVERISHESARLGRLVSELLDLSRLQGAEARPAAVPVRLDDVVAEAVDRATPHADARDISIVRGGPSGAVVPGVETQLVTAVANLLDNAINYSPEATRVAVAIRGRGPLWEITVTDQGLGIPEGDLDRIFERFYRVDPARSRATGGTGLGLAIVKHIVRNHGGEVRVWSSLDAGSSFTLCLPAGPVPVAATQSSETSHAQQSDNVHEAPADGVVTAAPQRHPVTSVPRGRGGR